MKFISSTGGAENFFANVSTGDAQGMYYLSSSGLKCKVKNKHTIDAKNYVTSETNKLHLIYIPGDNNWDVIALVSLRKISQ